MEIVCDLSLADARHETGNCWVIHLPQVAPGDSSNEPKKSILQLFEDGRPLGPAHAPHDQIRSHGRGHFSHWHDDSTLAAWPLSASSTS